MLARAGSKYLLMLTLLFFSLGASFTFDKSYREERKKQEIDKLQKRFQWWPTDARPSPVKDDRRAGYWWWPQEAGQVKPWGNRGYVYVYKIIFDYQEEELPPPKPQELRPSLLIKKIIKNVKVYFDYNKAVLRQDAVSILENAVATLGRNNEASILITGNCDRRGSESYNQKLGRTRAEAVKKFMLNNGIPEERIRIVSRGKLDAVAPITDIIGMQKDRNAQFMIAEVDEAMLPSPGIPELPGAQKIEENEFIVEEQEAVESEVKVSTREYKIQKGDTLWKIAQKELGNGYRWKYLYELNKAKIKDPNKLRPGTIIIIPVE